MKEILDRWKAFLSEGRQPLLKEVRYIESNLLPPEFINGLPDVVKNTITNAGALDFAFELYPKVFNKPVNVPLRFFVPLKDREQFFDFGGDPIAREATAEEMKQRGSLIPILPKDWYNAFLLRLGVPQIKAETKKEKRNLSFVKTLAVFDFDDTLYNTEKAKKRATNDSHLSPDSIPEPVKESEWITDVVYKAQELCSNPSVYCVMMTGRVEKVFKEKIDKILNDKRLFFAETHYNDFSGDTVEYKTKEIYNILSKLPNAKNLIMWEDQEDKAEKYSEEFSPQINFKMHLVKDKQITEQKQMDTSTLAILHNMNEYILFDAKRLVEYCQTFDPERANEFLSEQALIDNKTVIAYLKIEDGSQVKTRIGAECMDAAEVILAGLNPNMVGSRLGSFLMRAVANMHPEGLMGDRSSISASARLAMQRMYGSAQTKTIIDKETGEKLVKLDDKDAPKTKSKKDDCKVYHGDGEDFLNYVYLVNDKTLNTDELIARANHAFSEGSKATGDLLSKIDLEMLVGDAGSRIYHLRTTSVT